MNKAAQTNDQRRRELAKIHIGAKQLGMDDDAYRDMLFTVARVRSAADLDAAGRQQVLDHLKACGFKPKRPKQSHPGRPHNMDSENRGPYLKKIEAMLADASRPWSYADGIAKRMFHVELIAFCDEEQLRKIVAALTYDAKRHGRKVK